METKLEDLEALTVALAQERVSAAQTALALRQRELEAVVVALRAKYETPEFRLVSLDPSRGVITRERVGEDAE